MYSLKHFLYRPMLKTFKRFGPVLWPLLKTIMQHFSPVDCTSKTRMMHLLLVLLVFVLYTFKETCEATVTENSELGRLIDLRKVNLLANFNERK